MNFAAPMPAHHRHAHLPCSVTEASGNAGIVTLVGVLEASEISPISTLSAGAAAIRDPLVSACSHLLGNGTSNGDWAWTPIASPCLAVIAFSVSQSAWCLSVLA